MENQKQYDNIQIATIGAVSFAALMLALWLVPEWSWVTVLSHIAFEIVRAVMVLGNVKVAKQSKKGEWYKPFIVGLGSVVMTVLIGASIASEYSVAIENFFAYTNPAGFFHKQMGNIGLLFIEITLGFLFSGEDGYKKLEEERDQLRDDFADIMANHYGIDHKDIESWGEVCKLIVNASQSEREELKNIKESLRTFKNDLETFKNGSEKFKTILESNKILIQENEVSVNGFAPIFHEECGTINPTTNNRQQSLICSGCGEKVSKPFKTQIRNLKSGT